MSVRSGPMAGALRIVGGVIIGLSAFAGGARAQNIGVFVGDTILNGNLGGLTGADATCQAMGSAAFPGSGPWVAWLSTPTFDAKDRIDQPGPTGDYVRASQPSAPPHSI